MLDKLLAKLKENRERVETPIDDDETTDKHLKSLRRQKRLQDEQVEKETLINKIKDFERGMTRRNVFGIDEGQEAKLDRLKVLKSKKIGLKKDSILKQKKLMLNKGKRKNVSLFFK